MKGFKLFKMKNKLNFLLIQARESNHLMIKNELECFKRILNSKFKKIQKGELIGFDRKGKIYSQFNGKVLMPLYQEQGNEGFYIIQNEK